MRAGRAGDRDQQSQCRRTRGRAGCAVAHTDCPVGTRPGQCGRCRRARMGPAAAGEATWPTSGQESHPTQWPITRLPISPTVSGRLADDTNAGRLSDAAPQPTIAARHCMPNHSLPSHLLDWLWIGLSTGPNGAAAEMIPSSIAASAYWRGWTLKAWRYFLSRLLQGVRKGSFSGRLCRLCCIVYILIGPGLPFRFNIMAAPSVAGADAPLDDWRAC